MGERKEGGERGKLHQKMRLNFNKNEHRTCHLDLFTFLLPSFAPLVLFNLPLYPSSVSFQRKISSQSDFLYLTSNTGLPSTSRRGSTPRPGTFGAESRPFMRWAVVVAMVTGP